MPRILVAPTAPASGSENTWIWDIVSEVNEQSEGLSFTCVTEGGTGHEHNGLDLVVLRARSHEELGGALLPFRIAIAARRSGVLAGADIVHHALPFALGRTYSLLAAQTRWRRVPFVVGPVQTPLEWTAPDEHHGALVATSGGERTGYVYELGNWLAKSMGSGLGPIMAQLSATTLRSAERVVAIGESARTRVIEQGVDPDRVSIIPPPIATLPLDEISSSPRASEALHIVTAGYLIRRKAVDETIVAVADLAAAGKSVVLHVVGEGPQHRTLRYLAEERPGGSAVRFHGWMNQRELSALMRSSHVYVSMSKAESWGLALSEALAAGMTVVSADNVGARSQVALGAPIRIVPVGSPIDLGHVLDELYSSSSAARAESGIRGARWTTVTLSAAVVARQWRQVYMDALDGQYRRYRPSGVDGEKAKRAWR